MKVPGYVKTSLAPGSKVVTEYLDKAGLSVDLNALGFDTVGYGCTTCIGNSGPLPPEVSKAIGDGKLVASAVLLHLALVGPVPSLLRATLMTAARLLGLILERRALALQ